MKGSIRLCTDVKVEPEHFKKTPEAIKFANDNPERFVGKNITAVVLHSKPFTVKKTEQFSIEFIPLLKVDAEDEKSQ
jgi:hypothetical protein